jgi:hypothetical protein
MTSFSRAYVALWATACLGALALYLADRPAFALSHRDYWRFLFAPCKVAIFALAAISFILMAP